jgi:hypothetical protein
MYCLRLEGVTSNLTLHNARPLLLLIKFKVFKPVGLHIFFVSVQHYATLCKVELASNLEM